MLVSLVEGCLFRKSGKYKKISSETAETEKSLDRAVYKLYNLSAKEIKLVEDN